MVGIVLVSHSKSLAEALADYTKMMAPNAHVAPAGGMDDGSFGTSYEIISAAVESVSSSDGGAVLMDMGSAVMTTEMVLEDIEDVHVRMVNCPFVEGAVEGTVLAQSGASLDELCASLEGIAAVAKF